MPSNRRRWVKAFRCRSGSGSGPSQIGEEAERLFATLTERGASEALNELLYTVQDETEVHRVVLPYRAWDLLDLIGQEHAHATPAVDSLLRPG